MGKREYDILYSGRVLALVRVHGGSYWSGSGQTWVPGELRLSFKHDPMHRSHFVAYAHALCIGQLQDVTKDRPATKAVVARYTALAQAVDAAFESVRDEYEAAADATQAWQARTSEASRRVHEAELALCQCAATYEARFGPGGLIRAVEDLQRAKTELAAAQASKPELTPEEVTAKWGAVWKRYTDPVAAAVP